MRRPRTFGSGNGGGGGLGGSCVSPKKCSARVARVGKERSDKNTWDHKICLTCSEVQQLLLKAKIAKTCAKNDPVHVLPGTENPADCLSRRQKYDTLVPRLEPSPPCLFTIRFVIVGRQLARRRPRYPRVLPLPAQSLPLSCVALLFKALFVTAAGAPAGSAIQDR